MSIFDYLLMGIVLMGVFYLLYRSIWKNRSKCSGCAESGNCSSKQMRH